MTALSLSELSGTEWTLGIAMLLVLGASAICDHVTCEAPDVLTVGYAVLGIYTACCREALVLGLVLTAAVFFIWQPWRPAWVRRLNRRLVVRIMGDDPLKADEPSRTTGLFFERNMTAISCFGMAVVLLGLTAAFLIQICNGVGSRFEPYGNLICFLCLLALYLLAVFHPRQPAAEDTEAVALGEADILIFIGIIGYYGCGGAAFGLAASMFVALILYLIRMVLQKKAERGMPLLPAMFFSAPARMAAVILFAAPMTRVFVESGWNC